MLQLRTDDFYTIHASALGGPVLLPTTSQLSRCCSVGQKLTNRLAGKVASYDGATLKVTELFSKAILLPMFVYGDYMAVCLT